MAFVAEDRPFSPDRPNGDLAEPTALDTWAKVCRLSSWVALAGLATVVATGVWLLFFYQPVAASVWIDIDEAPRSASVQQLHLVASYLSGVALAAWAFATAVRHRLRGVLHGAIATGSFAISMVVGFSLPWQQMELWAVTTGTDIVGYSTAIDGGSVEFLLIDGVTVSPETLQRLLAAHLLFAGIAVVAVLVPVLRSARSRFRNSR